MATQPELDVFHDKLGMCHNPLEVYGVKAIAHLYDIPALILGVDGVYGLFLWDIWVILVKWSKMTWLLLWQCRFL